VTVSNHQSWPDILILQTILRRVPPVKFFTKQQLIWIPFLGLAMWLLGFPYVRRLSREQIAVNPALLELDRKATLEACDGFRNHPTTVLNFLEGTRFTAEKHSRQNGRFRSLLNPKSGGLNLVIGGLGDKLDCLIDVTIDYPDGTPTFWEFMKGECRGVEVLAQCREIPGEVLAADDAEARRQALERWVETLWREKDARLHHRHGAGEPRLAS
jgi:1-acyl-sn-glycerol-3-phosphate acyltransferase